MFVRNLHEVGIDRVATILEKYFKPTGIVTAKWSWKDDEGKSHTRKLDRVLYLPEYHVKIIISTDLADNYDDDEGIYIKHNHHSS